MNLCLCDSRKAYPECCQIFHQGTGLPATALELMRSRYSAYALQNPAYIIKTTHPKNPAYRKELSQWVSEIETFCQDTQFQKLEIIEFDETSVTFIAYLRHKGRDASFKEKSRFEKVGPHWLYLNGIVKQIL